MRVLLILLALWAAPVWAVQPDEMLADPVLEARAREISRELRCPVCQNETIDDSNATVSRDLRLRVRERVMAGDTNDEVIRYLVYGKPGEFAGFGEKILMNPTAQGVNLILWGAAPALLLLALGLGWAAVRRRAGPAPEGLTADERARLDEILKS